MSKEIAVLSQLCPKFTTYMPFPINNVPVEL